MRELADGDLRQAGADVEIYLDKEWHLYQKNCTPFLVINMALGHSIETMEVQAELQGIKLEDEYKKAGWDKENTV